MTAYFIRRFLLVVPTFVGITVLIFVITRFVPGGPIERIIAQAQQQALEGGGAAVSETVQRQPLSDDQIELLKKYYGFDKPALVSYGLWLGKIVRGDLGTSTRYYDPVWEMIRDRIPISLYFGLLTLVAMYGICIPLGIAKAIRHKSVFDDASSVLVFVGYAIPGWVAGILMILLFASHWEVFPLGELVGENFENLSLWGRCWIWPGITVMPLTAYLIGAFSFMTFLMKNTLMDNLAADYVSTAMAKGLTFRRAVFGHALEKQPDSHCHDVRQQHQRDSVRLFPGGEGVQYRRYGAAGLRIRGGAGLPGGHGRTGDFQRALSGGQHSVRHVRGSRGSAGEIRIVQRRCPQPPDQKKVEAVSRHQARLLCVCAAGGHDPGIAGGRAAGQ
jgi:microcin C transport system permease protein